MPEFDYFIDTHCHLFTAADIPFWETIRHAQRKLRHPLFSLFMPFAPWVNLDKYKPFIHFFESESHQNVARLLGESGQAMTAWQVTARKGRVFTPLVMDFDLNGNVDKLDAQIGRLTKTLKGVTDAKVLPFVGVDPRKFVYDGNGRGSVLLQEDAIRQGVLEFVRKYKIKSAEARRRPGRLKSGDIIGIKLYPPLGFRVSPVNDNERRAFHTVYREFLTANIPVTVHCQEDSFELTDNHDDSVSFCTASNWVQVLQSRNPDLSGLRINFAHFGGEKGIQATLDWADSDASAGHSVTPTDPGIPDLKPFSAWTRQLIGLLKGYPNTYADISALDFANSEDAARLLWVIAFDEAGEFGDGEKLVDKLLWGSDYPMILTGYSDYPSYFSAFMKAIRKDLHNLGGIHRLPDRFPEPEFLLRKLVSENPQKFLFG